MSANYNAMIEYWGLGCPNGGKVCICEGARSEFIGCCLSDPCADGSGTCPEKHIRQTTFSEDKYAYVPIQDCDSAEGKDNWYTCEFNKPPFLGCC
ncbi:hypothetical protein FALBO_15865, partial [Fusarium albosuccineum]